MRPSHLPTVLLTGLLLLSLRGTASGQARPFEVSVPDTSHLRGIDAAVEFTVTANSPRIFTLVVAPLGGAPVRVDSSTGPVGAVRLRLAPAGAPQPRFPSGGYLISVIGTTSSGQADTTRFRGVFEVPPVSLNPVPSASDMPPLRPERVRPSLGLSIGTGLFVAGATIVAGRAARAPELERAGVAQSNRPIVLGISLGALTGLASQVIRGRPDARAVLANRVIREEFEQEVRLAVSANEFIASIHESTVILTEVQP